MDQGSGGSALTDVSDIETGELCRIGGGFADCGDAERSQRKIPGFARNDGNTVRDGSNCVLAGEDKPVETCEIAESGIERGVILWRKNLNQRK